MMIVMTTMMALLTDGGAMVSLPLPSDNYETTKRQPVITIRAGEMMTIIFLHFCVTDPPIQLCCLSPRNDKFLEHTFEREHFRS